MYTKDEVRQFKQEFWTAFGVIMNPHLSASGFKANWINYKTEVKNIVFKMDADNKNVSIAIQLVHKDDGIRELYWEQFLEFKSLFHSTMGEEWIWDTAITNEYGIDYSSISITTKGNIFDKDQWQEILELSFRVASCGENLDCFVETRQPKLHVINSRL